MQRRERTRHLIELGGLIQKAGLVDLTDDDRATILGGLLGLADMLQGEGGAALGETGSGRFHGLFRGGGRRDDGRDHRRNGDRSVWPRGARAGHEPCQEAALNDRPPCRDRAAHEYDSDDAPPELSIRIRVRPYLLARLRAPA